MAQEVPYSTLANDAQVLLAIIHDKLPDRPPSYSHWTDALKRIWDICPKCWAKNPAERIELRSIILDLRNMKSGVSRPQLSAQIILSPNSKGRSDPENTLRMVLSNLDQPELEKVTTEGNPINYNGYSSVYKGFALLKGEEIKIAVKRRYHCAGRNDVSETTCTIILCCSPNFTL